MTFDTSTWEEISFGEIARSLTNAAKNPLSENLVRYVGLEHIEPGNIHIKSWGNVADGITFTRVFRKGHVLFGKRRAYQKKAAVAEFDGVCSGDILVLEAIEKSLSPELLPFIVQSDRFFDCAVKTSAGSLSPRTKFKDLAKFSLKLPPLDKQKRIADLLWSIDEVVESKIVLSRQLNGIYCSFLEEIHSEQRGKKKYKVKDICTINANNLSAKTDPNYRFKYLDIASIIAPNKIGELKEYSFEDAPSRARRIVEQGNLVLSLVRPYQQSFVMVENEVHHLIASTGTAVLKAGDSIDTKYLFHSLFTKNFLSFCEQRMNGTNYPAITPSDLKQYEVYCPALDEQRVFSKKLSAIIEIEEGLLKEVEILNGINKQLINQIFG